MEQLNKTNCPICDSHNFAPFMDVKDHMITKEDFKILKCTACGFHFTNPIPSIANIGAYYKSEEYVSHSSSKKGIINSLYNLVRNHTLKKKVSLLQSLSSGKELLDIGSGTGHFLNQAKQTGFVVEGLEPDQDAVNFAKTNFKVELFPLAHLYELQTFCCTVSVIKRLLLTESYSTIITFSVVEFLGKVKTKRRDQT